MATIASPTLNITFDFPVADESLIVGFILNKDDVPVGPAMDPTARSFTCTTQIENRPTIFTLVAVGLYDNFSAASEPYEFTPPPEIFQDISSPTNLQINIVLREV